MKFAPPALFFCLLGLGYSFVQEQPQPIQARNVEQEVLNMQKTVNSAIDIAEQKYIKKGPSPTPSPDDGKISICRCNGSKVMVHGDGHQTPCQCTTKPGGCVCKPLNPPLPPEEMNNENQ